ncbi:hypothetical protein JCM16161A_02290 [Vulcanisaeta sp. JCM 16161]|uniref:hypothetical protein n=1 Tax=Vulcanisaeta sp. JCM 16161 TaxID=1295372 RepID=UPI0006D11DDE|nr:hypothetical protein [Vulcanisaeta sp. JCM 16161]
MAGLDERALRVITQYATGIEQVAGMLANGRLRRTSLRLRLKPVRVNTRRLAKYCGRENKRVCEELIRLLSPYFSEDSIEDAIKWGLSLGIMPEVVLAYMYAFVRLTTEDPRQWSGELRGSLSKVVIDYARLALNLEPLRGSFTVTDARNVVPALRLRGPN